MRSDVDGNHSGVASFESLLALWCKERVRGTGPFVLGIAGSQGSGKSTLATALARRLSVGEGVSTLVLSLDDFYLTSSDRKALGTAVHPLLETRGVPDTHDLALLRETLDALRGPPNVLVPIPRFDKLRDDREPANEWISATSGSDLILLEGWCVGARDQSDDEVLTPISDFESQEDGEGHWRRFVNQALRTDYAALFDELDALLFLEAPSFAPVLAWRLEQERGLGSAPGQVAMRKDRAAVAQFIRHYERLTTHMIETVGGYSDILIKLADDRGARSIEFRA